MQLTALSFSVPIGKKGSVIVSPPEWLRGGLEMVDIEGLARAAPRKCSMQVFIVAMPSVVSATDCAQQEWARRPPMCRKTEGCREPEALTRARIQPLTRQPACLLVRS